MFFNYTHRSEASWLVVFCFVIFCGNGDMDDTATATVAAPVIWALPAFLCQYFSACGTYYTPRFTGTMQNISAEMGEDAVFVCQIENVGRNKVAFLKLEPPTLLTWQHKIFASRPHKYRLENPSEGDPNKWALHVLSLQESDAGIYMCQLGTSPMISQTAQLFLSVPAKINGDKTAKDMMVKENENVTLFCAADGRPTPMISWKRADDGVIITNDPQDGFGEAIIYKNNLTIYKVSRSHMTDYMCIADNGIMAADSWTVKLHVHFPPTVYAVDQQVGAYSGNNVKLKCKAEAWPRPEFTWYYNNNLILTNSTKYTMLIDIEQAFIFESLTVLIVKMVVKSDLGAYTCVAKNDYSQRTATVNLFGKDLYHNERTRTKEKVDEDKKIDSTHNFVLDMSGAGSGDDEDIEDTFSDDDDFSNLTVVVLKPDSKNTSPLDVQQKESTEMKPRQQPPPHGHQSDERSSNNYSNAGCVPLNKYGSMNLHLIFFAAFLWRIVVFCC